MCIDLFRPGECITLEFLLEQVWFRQQRDAADELEIDEIYDILIYNPHGNPPLDWLWALFPHDCTRRAKDGREPQVEVGSLQPGTDPSPWDWAFKGPPIWKDRSQNEIERTFAVDPPLVRDASTKSVVGVLLAPDVKMPSELDRELQDALADLKKTVVLLDLTSCPLAAGKRGWLQLRVRPASVDEPAAKSQRFPFMPEPFQFSRRLSVMCPVLLRDKIDVLLSHEIWNTKNPQAAQKYRRLSNVLFSQGIYRSGTCVRIEDHRISIITCGDIDIHEATCSKGATFYGVIPQRVMPAIEADDQRSTPTTALHWACGAHRNREFDLVHNAQRVVDRLSYIGREDSIEEIVRDLKPSGKHEAFSGLVGRMRDTGILKPHSQPGFVVLEADQKTREQGFAALRKMYAGSHGTNDAQLPFLKDFPDLHPFRIDFRLSWIAVSKKLQKWLDSFNKALGLRQNESG